MKKDKKIAYDSRKIALKTLEEQSNNVLNYTFEDGLRLIDVIILVHLDHDKISFKKKPISDFLNKYEKQVISIIESDTTENNPIALIMRNRTNYELLIQLLNQIDFSETNIEKKPGLKMLTTTFKCITPNGEEDPSDFVCVLSEELAKYEHLNKFINDLKLAYMLSNIFTHKKLTQENINHFSNLTQKQLKNFNFLSNAQHPNIYYKKIINNSIEYLNTISKSDVEDIKLKIENQLISNTSVIDIDSLDMVRKYSNHEFKSQIYLCDFFIDKLNLNKDEVKIYNGEEHDYNTFIDKQIAIGIKSSLDNIIYGTKIVKTNNHDVTYKSNLINAIENNKINELISEINTNENINNFYNYHENKSIDSELNNQINNYFSYLLQELTPDNIVKECYKDINYFMYDENMYNLDIIYKNKKQPIIKSLLTNITAFLLEEDEEELKNILDIKSAFPYLSQLKNKEIIPQIGAIIRLKEIIPDSDNILNKINENIVDLLENKMVLNKNFEIVLENTKETNQQKEKTKIEEAIKPLIETIKNMQDKINNLNSLNSPSKKLKM